MNYTKDFWGLLAFGAFCSGACGSTGGDWVSVLAGTVAICCVAELLVYGPEQRRSVR